MKTPQELTPAQLAARIEKISAKQSVVCDKFIAAGRGHERHNDIMKMDDPLALEHRALSLEMFDLQMEKERRVAYHGSLNKIPSFNY